MSRVVASERLEEAHRYLDVAMQSERSGKADEVADLLLRSIACSLVVIADALLSREDRERP